MFDVGFWELALIALIGLIVLGPERLPRVAHTLGLWVGRARRYVRGLTAELEQEVRAEEMREQFSHARRQVESQVRKAAGDDEEPDWQAGPSDKDDKASGDGQ